MKYLWETNKELINQLQRKSKLFHSPIHGFKHWRTVEKNGLYLSQFNDGDPDVISHFAYFHDCMRVNEHRDDGHGIRGGKYALKNRDLIDLNEEQLNILYKAHDATIPFCVSAITGFMTRLGALRSWPLMAWR